MVLSLDGKSTHIKINPSRELRRIPTDSFRIDIICKPEIPEHEPEHLIGKGNNKYLKYPFLSKIGYDFGIDYNNSNGTFNFNVGLEKPTHLSLETKISKQLDKKLV